MNHKTGVKLIGPDGRWRWYSRVLTPAGRDASRRTTKHAAKKGLAQWWGDHWDRRFFSRLAWRPEATYLGHLWDAAMEEAASREAP